MHNTFLRSKLLVFRYRHIRTYKLLVFVYIGSFLIGFLCRCFTIQYIGGAKCLVLSVVNDLVCKYGTTRHSFSSNHNLHKSSCGLYFRGVYFFWKLKLFRDIFEISKLFHYINFFHINKTGNYSVMLITHHSLNGNIHPCFIFWLQTL